MKARVFILGLIVGSLLAATVSVTAANREVTATLTDNFKITIDGKELKLGNDYAVLNYNNRLYTPVRVVAEGMDGVVNFDEATNTAEIIKPAPQLISAPSPEPEPEPTPEPTPKPQPVESYRASPVKAMKEDVTVNIFGLGSDINSSYLHLDLKNDSSYPLMLNMADAYIEVEGTKYPADFSRNNQWLNSISSNVELEEEVIIFSGDIERAKKVTVYLPIDVKRSLVGGSDVTIVYDYMIDFE